MHTKPINSFALSEKMNQMMKKLFLVVLVLSIGLGAQAQEKKAHQFTLEDCLRYAFANNYDRKSMELSTESQKITYEQSKLQRMPNLNASAGESLLNGENGASASGNIGVSSSVTIYQGGNISNTIDAYFLETERSETQISQYDNDLVIQILQSFLTVLGNEELLKYQQAVLQTSGEQWKQGQVKFKVGSILESDLLLLEAQYYSDSNNVVDTKISRENSLLSLKVLLSMDPTDKLEIIYPNADNLEELSASLPDEEEAVRLALDYLPDLKIKQYDIQIAKKNIDLAKSSFYPSISANANIGTNHQNYNTFAQQISNGISEQVGISINIPIYSRGATKANVKKSEISMQQAQLDYEQNQLAIRQTVVQEYRNVTSAYNSFKISDIKQNAYLKSYRAYELQFEHGSITTVELLQQQNNYINALNDYVKDKYSFLLQRKILDVYMGKSITL
jgi:Outer membrane protein